MSAETVPHASDDIAAASGNAAVLFRPETPDATVGGGACALASNGKRSPGIGGPASRTPIGSPVPERQPDLQEELAQSHHVNSFSLSGLFGVQERPNSAPVEARHLSVTTPPPGGAGLGGSSPARGGHGAVGAGAGELRGAAQAQLQQSQHGPTGLQLGPCPGSSVVSSTSPEMPTFHPQPRRAHQPLVTPLLESEVAPPLSPAIGEKKQLLLSANTCGPRSGSAGGTDGIERRLDQFNTSTPSPDRDGFVFPGEDCLDLTDSSPYPGVAHRSVQNTPEPTHYYGQGVGPGGQPISTPSPHPTPGGGGILSLGPPPPPPRFPQHGNAGHTQIVSALTSGTGGSLAAATGRSPYEHAVASAANLASASGAANQADPSGTGSSAAQPGGLLMQPQPAGAALGAGALGGFTASPSGALAGGFSAAPGAGLALPPPLPPPGANVAGGHTLAQHNAAALAHAQAQAAQAAALGQVSSQALGFVPPYQMPLDAIDANALAQAAKGHFGHVGQQQHAGVGASQTAAAAAAAQAVVAAQLQQHGGAGTSAAAAAASAAAWAQMQGHLQGMQAGNPQDAHHLQHLAQVYGNPYNRAGLSGLNGLRTGVTPAWALPNCSVPVGFPSFPQAMMDALFTSVGGPSAVQQAQLAAAQAAAYAAAQQAQAQAQAHAQAQTQSQQLQAQSHPQVGHHMPGIMQTLPSASGTGPGIGLGSTLVAPTPADHRANLSQQHGSAAAGGGGGGGGARGGGAGGTKSGGNGDATTSEYSSAVSSALPAEASVTELRGNVVQLSQTQAGSKYLQRQLLRGHAGVVETILSEVEQDIAHLMCDAYGNYLCSVAFQACAVRQRKRMLEKLSQRVANIACDKRGTHALQALIGLLSTPDEQQILMVAVKDHVIELCMDPNGTHVVQRLLYCFKPPATDAIYYPVVQQLVDVAHHPYGLCVLKKCISQVKGSPGMATHEVASANSHRDMLLAQLARHALDLVQSPYGNYAVQHALEEWGGQNCTPIFRALEGRMMQLSIQKFSSNVVEKLFCAAPPEFRKMFIDELIESDKMSVLVNSNYGHYVVKRALQLADGEQVKLLLSAIRGNIQSLPNRRLRAKWEKVMSAGSDRNNRSGVDDDESDDDRQINDPDTAQNSKGYQPSSGDAGQAAPAFQGGGGGGRRSGGSSRGGGGGRGKTAANRG